jgi:hypothetical protein
MKNSQQEIIKDHIVTRAFNQEVKTIFRITTESQDRLDLQKVIKFLQIQVETEANGTKLNKTSNMTMLKKRAMICDICKKKDHSTKVRSLFAEMSVEEKKKKYKRKCYVQIA